MMKLASVAVLVVVVAGTCLFAPEAEACDAAICEEVTGCFGCVWYGVLFTDCFLGGCNSCATKRCEAFAQKGTGADGGQIAQATSDPQPSSQDLCRERAREEVPEIEVLEVKLLPART